MDIDGARAEIKDCITRLENIQSDLQAIVNAEILADFGDEVVGEILERYTRSSRGSIMEMIPVIVVTPELRALMDATDTHSMSEDTFMEWLLGLATGELPMRLFRDDKSDA
jgi:hypothetical protein